MKKYLMGIDRGTTNVKVAVYDLNGTEVKVSNRSCEKVKSPKPGFAEQDMDIMWNDTVEAIRGIWDDDIRPEQIEAIGLSGQGGGMFLIDKSGNPVRKGIVSLDSRVFESAKKWKDQERHQAFLELWDNGNPTVPEALLYWIKQEEPENYQKIHWILQCKDWIRYKLTGKVNYETTDASNGRLIDSDLKYQLNFLDGYGLSDMKKKFPELLNPWDIAGNITEEAASFTGLLPGTPVAAGGHDVAMVAFGCGCYKKGQLTTVLGTFGLNLLLIEKPHMMMQNYSKIVLSGSKDCYLMMNGGSVGASTDWYIDTFCGEEKAKAKEQGVSVFDALEEEVLTAPDEAKSKIICHPYVEAPYTLPGYEDAKFGYYGATMNTTKAQLIRAYYEGVALEMSMSLDVSKKAVHKLDSMRLIGGGAASKLWGQMFADANDIPVEIMDIKEAGCRGAALNAGIAIGIYKGHADVEKLAHPVKKRYLPDAKGVAYMRQKEKITKEIARLIQGTWEGAF